MKKTIVVTLAGHSDRYEMDEGAHARLSQYLERAAARLRDDPDHAEVIGDLERSVGDRLSTLIGDDQRVLSATDIDGVLEEVGTVETGHDPDPRATDQEPRPRPRRLQRIRQGQQIAGVCNGLAAYSSIRVDWVRTLFVLGTLVTGGILGLVYIALAFALPISEKQEA